MPTTSAIANAESDAARLLAVIDDHDGKWRETDSVNGVRQLFGWTRERFVAALRVGVRAGTMVAVPLPDSMFLTRRPRIEGQTEDARQASIRANLKLLEQDGWYFPVVTLSHAQESSPAELEPW